MITTDEGKHYENEYDHLTDNPIQTASNQPLAPTWKDKVPPWQLPPQPKPVEVSDLDRRTPPTLPIIPQGPLDAPALAPPTSFPQGGFDKGFFKGPLPIAPRGQRLAGDVVDSKQMFIDMRADQARDRLNINDNYAAGKYYEMLSRKPKAPVLDIKTGKPKD